MNRSSGGQAAWALVAILVVSFALDTYRVGVEPLLDWDEAPPGGRAAEMLETGDWSTVHFNRDPAFHKPPLYYWIIASSYALGGIDETTTRLPNAVGAAFLLVVLFGLGSWIADRRSGVFTAGILLSIPFLVELVRHARPDLILYPASFGAILAFVRERYLVTGALVAGALLTKGMAGLLAPLTLALWMAASWGLASVGLPVRNRLLVVALGRVLATNATGDLGVPTNVGKRNQHLQALSEGIRSTVAPEDTLFADERHALRIAELEGLGAPR